MVTNKDTRRLTVYWGASQGAAAYLDHEQPPDYFIDSNPTTWGTYFYGVPVFPPHYLSVNEVERLVVTSDSWSEISESAIALGVPTEIIQRPGKAQIHRQIFRQEATRKKISRELHKILGLLELSHPPVAVGGTALGFYREQSFIPWDHDCDFRVAFSDWNTIVSLREFDGAVSVTPRVENKPNIRAVFWLAETFVPIEFDFYDSGAAIMVDTYNEYCWSFATSKFTSPEAVNIHGNNFFVPSSPAEYLSSVFGENYATADIQFSNSDYNGTPE